MSEESDQSHDKIWFLKKGSKVFGPFAASKVRGFLMDGKIELSDEVSRDKKNWKNLRQQPEVVPLQMRNKEGFSDSDVDDELDPGKKGSLWLPIILFILMIAVGIGYSFVVQDDFSNDEPDCLSKPGININWNSCNKRRFSAENVIFDGMSATNALMNQAKLTGSSFKLANMKYVNLSDADLSYSDFSGANLKGANLQNADLRSAILSQVDLRYVDLTDANLGGVNLSGSKLDGTIWTNGKPCKQGSVGKCIQ